MRHDTELPEFLPADDSAAMTSPCIEIPVGVKLQLDAARRLGMTIEVLDRDFGHLFELGHGGRAVTMVGGRSPLNDAVAARIAQDKYFTGVVLARAGFRVPATSRCLKADHFRLADYAPRGGMAKGVAFAKAHGFPVIVKPNQRSHGLDVFVAQDQSALADAIEQVWRYDYLALVQTPVAGTDLRLDFLDGQFLAGYTRHACTLTGDGTRTIRELLVAARPAMATSPERWRWIADDPDWRQQVTDRGWAERSILPADEVIRLGNMIRNLNRWAIAEVLDGIPDGWLGYARRIGQAMHLRHFGVDIRAGGLHDDPEGATIIEVNASPSLVQLYSTGHAEIAIEAQMRVLRAVFDMPA